jgi:intracellular septation protein A
MNSSLIWFGFLPVVAFLLMSSFGGKRQALWGALIMGAMEAGYSIAVVGALDYMSLMAFAVLGVFVAASLRNEDDFFFKISGAVINAIQAVVMLVAFYGFHRAMLLDAAHKYLDLDALVAANPQLNKEIITETFRVLSSQLPAWLILHALLTVYAAANWGKWAWAFVNVPGLIITLALAFAFAEVSVLKGR